MQQVIAYSYLIHLIIRFKSAKHLKRTIKIKMMDERGADGCGHFTFRPF